MLTSIIYYNFPVKAYSIEFICFSNMGAEYFDLHLIALHQVLVALSWKSHGLTDKKFLLDAIAILSFVIFPAIVNSVIILTFIINGSDKRLLIVVLSVPHVLLVWTRRWDFQSWQPHGLTNEKSSLDFSLIFFHAVEDISSVALLLKIF